MEFLSLTKFGLEIRNDSFPKGWNRLSRAMVESTAAISFHPYCTQFKIPSYPKHSMIL